jgi:transposase
MITPADSLPDDLETAHQLIRELLQTLSQQIHLNAKLQHQLEQLLRQRYPMFGVGRRKSLRCKDRFFD